MKTTKKPPTKTVAKTPTNEKTVKKPTTTAKSKRVAKSKSAAAERPATIRYAKSIPVKYRADVLVVGGGPAGAAAAVCAARQGAKVRLIEAGSCLGGLGTAGLVPAFMQFTDGINFLAGGFGRELYDRLKADGGLWGDSSIKVEALKRLYESMLQEAGVEFTYHTQLIDLVKRGKRVEKAVCAAKSGLYAIEAQAFIDGTGDGDLCVLSGARYAQGDEQGNTMPGTLCTLWGGIDWDVVWGPKGVRPCNAKIEQAFKDGVLSLEDRHLPGMWRVGEKLGGGNIGHTFGVDGTDEVSLTEAYIWGRKSHLEYERYFKEYLRGFEKMELVVSAPLMGIRESRRIRCDYELNVADFDPASTFPDEIGRYSYPIDIHIAKPDRESYDQYVKDFSKRLGKGESYAIPYRSLTPVGLDNVWVSGRCIGTDRGMQASIRVMPCCYITGQAVGIAAALAVAKGVVSREINVKTLQRRLKKIGGYLPNH
ncbi:MAG: FAD-dependent oxidoreductase [Kiritimatiellia bacterium]|jgi:ribulose 1,5-bisphosphate synthetase/thiazole synthase